MLDYGKLFQVLLKTEISMKPRKDNGHLFSPFSFKGVQFKPEVNMFFWILCIKRKIT